jgi:hypothetical protein
VHDQHRSDHPTPPTKGTNMNDQTTTKPDDTEGHTIKSGHIEADDTEGNCFKYRDSNLASEPDGTERNGLHGIVPPTNESADTEGHSGKVHP